MHRWEFRFDLPEGQIAQYPPARRGDSRLLCVATQTPELTDRRFADLPDLLRPGDVLVFNDSRVLPARLRGVRDTGGKVEVLIERVLDARHALAQVSASKPIRVGTRLEFEGVVAEVEAQAEGFWKLQFFTQRSLMDVLAENGAVPLPPYIRRTANPADAERYQTVYARQAGSVAAPTAGLHFDATMLDRIRAKGVECVPVTLHVGAGTFQPLRVEQIGDHRMHAERVIVPEQTCRSIAQARARGGRVIAVGTTTVRSLETAALRGTLTPFEGETRLFIYPGFKFRCVDAVLTNFHQPESTLLMLVCAFAGTERILRAYRHAVAAGYRFYSYGDAMFIAARASSQ